MTAAQKLAKEEIANGKLRCEWRYSPVNGTLVFEAMLPAWPMPVGTVYARVTGGKTIEILNSFTSPNIKRCGVRTKLHEYILSCWPNCDLVMTGGATREGKKWMEKTGYRQAKNGDWVLKVKNGN